MDTAHTNLTSILADIEAQLTQAAELVLSGGMPEALYASTLRGALAMLPMPLAPRHIVVLGKLKQWKGTELIPAAVCEQLQAAVIAASRPPTEDAGSSGAVAPPVPASAPAKATVGGKRKQEAPAPAPAAKRAASQNSIASMFSAMGGQRLKVSAAELQEQRMAAARGEDYTPRVEKMAEFKSEEESAAAPNPLVHEFGCSKCGRKFSSKIALWSHERSHSASVQEKKFFEPPPPKPTREWLCLVPTGPASVVVSFAPLHEAAAKARAARESEEERMRMRKREADLRQQLREAEANVAATEHRRGSNARKSYTAKQKIKILAWYDEVRADATYKNKKESFESNSARSLGAPYTTVTGKQGLATPEERARITAACGKEWAQSLLRIDKTPGARKKGTYVDMEQKLYDKFKARRARGRKVSGRWITAMGRQLMRVLHPDKADGYKCGYSFRRRWCMRFQISMRRKTNAKNKTWAETEPVLLRYFATLRRRLQLTVTDSGETNGEGSGETNGEEAEPEDINPGFEELDGEELALDDEDDGDDDDDELEAAPKEAPAGMRFAESPPTPEQLAFSSSEASAADELVGRCILFHWNVVGWCAAENRGLMLHEPVLARAPTMSSSRFSQVPRQDHEAQPHPAGQQGDARWDAGEDQLLCLL